ncbi:MAG: toll/interleukin-1 receptor domain-containing protein [Bacillota bacterium]|nr:toll/interleukin-1 receptor domain-containing protein [Bacillota bacterium]
MSILDAFICNNCGSDEIHITEDGLICNNCQTPFEPIWSDHEGDIEQQRIFLIWAPPDAEFCQEIAAALKERSHEVLTNESADKSDESWRREFITCIHSCDHVIAALSHQALWGTDSCLDELAAALAVKAGKIELLLLEPEVEIDIPASLAHRPRLDLAAWQQEKADPAGYADWFSGRMKELFEKLERPLPPEYSDELLHVYMALGLPTMHSGRQDALLGRDFVGREWLTKDIEDWLDNPDGNRVCLFVADRGFGKSAWVTHYSHYSRRVAAAFFSNVRSFIYESDTTCLIQIIGQLACRLPDYRARLLPQLGLVRDLAELSPEEIFEQLIVDPLQDLEDEGRETLVILIDGLDEILPGLRIALTQTLLSKACRLPGWLRFLVTAESESELIDAPDLSAFVYEVDQSREEHLDDLRRYLRRYLDSFEQEHGEQALSTLVEQIISSGDALFLYACMLIDNYLDGKEIPTEPDEFPVGLDGVYDFWFRTNFPDPEHYRSAFHDLFAALVFSPYPLPLYELERLFHWTKDETRDVLRTASSLLLYERDRAGTWLIDFQHPHTGIWLLYRGTETYQIQAEEARQRLTRELAHLYVNEESDKLTVYEIITLPHLLSGSEEEAAREQVIKDTNLILSLFLMLNTRGDSLLVTLAGRSLFSILQIMGYDTSRASDPDELKFLKMVGLRNLAWGFRETGQLERARNVMKHAVRLGEELLESRNSYEDQSELGMTLQVYARILQALGESSEARSCHLKTLEFHERLYESRNNYKDQYRLATSCYNYANFLNLEGEEEEALVYYEKDIALSEGLLETKDSSSNKKSLSISYDKYAELLLALGDTAKAVDMFAKSIVLKEELAKSSKKKEDYQDLFENRDRYIHLLWNVADPDQLSTEQEKNISLGEELAASDDSGQVRIRLFSNYNNYACYLLDCDRVEEAQTLFEKALASHDALLAEEVDVPILLTSAYSNYANLLRDQGESTKARDLYRKHIALYERAQAKGDLDPEDYSRLLEIYRDYARFLGELGESREAGSIYERGIRLSSELDEDEFEEWQLRARARIHKDYAQLLLEEGKLSRSAELLAESNADYEKLLETEESSYSADLAESYQIYGQILKELGQDAGSQQAFARSMELAGQVAESYDDRIFLRTRIIMRLFKASDRWRAGERNAALQEFDLLIPFLERLVKNSKDRDDLDSLASTYSIYANYLWAAGDASKSRSYCEKHVASREKLLQMTEDDKTQNDLLDAYEQYALVLRELRYRSQAQLFEKKARRLRERIGSMPD